MSDHLERDENAEPRLAKEPRLRTDPNEAIEPIENAEPIDPIERNEPFDPIDRNESCDHSDRLNDMVRFSHGPSEIPECRNQSLQQYLVTDPTMQVRRTGFVDAADSLSGEE